MTASKILLVCLATLFTSYASSTPASETAGKTIITHYNLPKQNLLFIHQLYNDLSHIIYGSCNDSNSKDNCEITLDNLDIPGKSLSCNVTIHPIADKEIDIHYNANLALLFHGRGLVLIKDGQKLKITNINFNDCSRNEAEIEIDRDQILYSVVGTYVVAYENSYELFFANSKLCQNRPCRMTFDYDGKVVKAVAAWGEFPNRKKYLGIVQSVAHQSPVNGFIVKNNVDDVIFLFVFNNEGKQILNVRTGKDSSDVTISTVDNKIGTCLSTWIEVPSSVKLLRKLECKQFDLEGKLVKTELQVNVSSFIGEEKKIHYIARLNLPEGFILFVTFCPSNYHGPCTGSESYFAYHIDETGNKLKEIKINDFQCEYRARLMPPTAFKNEAGESCVYLVCQNNDYPLKWLHRGIRCFSRDEL